MSSSCSRVKAELVKCLARQECVRGGATVRECIAQNMVDDECMAIYNRFIRCRRGQLDMRTRLSGVRAQLLAATMGQSHARRRAQNREG